VDILKIDYKTLNGIWDQFRGFIRSVELDLDVDEKQALQIILMATGTVYAYYNVPEVELWKMLKIMTDAYHQLKENKNFS